MKELLRYRLGIDLGTTSIGTALVRLDGPAEQPEPCGILHMGVRIFDDGREPKSHEPLAVSRRMARQARRRRDRYIRRRQRLISAFVEAGLFPQDEVARKSLEVLPPYKLRAEGLDHKLPLFHFGRALFHLSQRRGFKSSRQSGKNEDAGKIKEGVQRLREQLDAEHCRTLGEYFHKHRIEKGISVRARLVGAKAKAEYPFYPERAMVADEFDRLWAAQAAYYPEVCTENSRTKIRDILLYQRPLKPVKPGKCTFEPSEDRCPIADPLFQRFRILQELNHLRIQEPGQCGRALDLGQRNHLLELLLQGKELKLADLYKQLKLPIEARFTLETANRDRIKGDEMAALLGGKKYFGNQWKSFSLDAQSTIVQRLMGSEESETIVNYLVQQGLDCESAGVLVEQDLPAGYGRISRKVLQKIVPFLEPDVVTYDVALALAGYHHSNFATGQIWDALPYYGEVLERHIPRGTGKPEDSEEKRIGKIANPTVHIALNQLRRVVNCVIKRFGPPEQIVIELARDLKMGEQRKKEEAVKNKENEERNKRIDRELTSLGLTTNGENRLRYKLWEELGGPQDRVCPYSGKPISITQLFSEEVEIEHILPFAQTYDDSAANKTVAFRFANRAKGNRTPHAAFADSPKIGGCLFDWDSILTRAWNFPSNKRWRFEPDALERFSQDGDFTARQLIDTAYASKLAREYLTAVCDKNRVWSVPGRLTALLRNKWGLDDILGMEDEKGVFHKNRNHHGHHAIDALVVALTDRSLLNRLSKSSVEMLSLGRRALYRVEMPWESLHSDARERMGRLVVSHRKDHGLGGPLHNDTAYGIVNESTVQHRIPLETLKPKELSNIKSVNLKDMLQEIYATVGEDGWKNALTEFQNSTGIRRLRLLENLSTIPIYNQQGHAYKAYKTDGNYCYDIWEEPSGKWSGRVISRFEANQNKGKMPPRLGPDGQPLKLRLIVDDTVQLNHPEAKYWRVAMISEGKAAFVPIHEGGNLRDRNRDKDDLFKYLVKSPNPLKELSCREVHVDECGFVMVRR